MEEMVFHTPKKVTEDKEKLKLCKGEALGVQFVIVKTKHLAYSSLQ
jgi:hypothetical protein